MQRNKELETFNFQAFLRRRRRNRENGIKGKVDRMSEEERMNKIIAELSEEMDARKRQWLDLTRTNEQYKREDTMEELKGDYQRTIQHTENMMIELDSFLFGSSFDSVEHGFSLNSEIIFYSSYLFSTKVLILKFVTFDIVECLVLRERDMGAQL